MKSPSKKRSRLKKIFYKGSSDHHEKMLFYQSNYQSNYFINMVIQTKDEYNFITDKLDQIETATTT